MHFILSQQYQKNIEKNVINKMVLSLFFFKKFAVKTLKQAQKVKTSKDVKGDLS